MRKAFFLSSLVAFSACGEARKPSLQETDAQCRKRAAAAQSPKGGITFGTRGLSGSVTLSSDFLSGRDPDDVYRECFIAQTGQEPPQPFDKGA